MEELLFSAELGEIESNNLRRTEQVPKMKISVLGIRMSMSDSNLKRPMFFSALCSFNIIKAEFEMQNVRGRKTISMRL